MLEYLIELDRKIFLLLNGAGSPFLDKTMLMLSSHWFWVPVYIFLIAYLIWKNKIKGLISIGIIFFTLLITDQVSVHFFKEVFERLRPCHDPLIIDQVKLLAENCGGQFGFVSSHATNSFGLAIVSAELVRNKPYTRFIFAWALIVSYSRIYLGVHYPGDILGGILLGLLLGWLILIINTLIKKNILRNGDTKKA